MTDPSTLDPRSGGPSSSAPAVPKAFSDTAWEPKAFSDLDGSARTTLLGRVRMVATDVDGTLTRGRGLDRGASRWCR